jgi:hypothetical protein
MIAVLVLARTARAERNSAEEAKSHSDDRGNHRNHEELSSRFVLGLADDGNDTLSSE